MSKNRKNFILGNIVAGIIFFIGVLYITIPSYYGIDSMAEVDTSDLFVSFTLVYSVLYLAKYILCGNEPNNESIYLCIMGSISGMLNVFLNYAFDSGLVCSMNLALFVFMITGVKLFTVDYYHDRKDVYYYIEGFLLAIFFTTGIVTTLNLFNNPIIQTIMMGFFIIIIGILESFNVSIKTLIKSKRFLKKIKLK